MKHYFYTLISGVVFCVAAFFPRESLGQCNCTGGVPATPIVYEVSLKSILLTNIQFKFPKFDGTIGQLTCVRLIDTFTTILTYHVQNRVPETGTYEFEGYRRSLLKGPGAPSSFSNYVTSPPLIYGPYTLGPFDPVGTDDEVTIGPDTPFHKVPEDKTSYNVNPFIGNPLDSVTFDYLNTSTITMLSGANKATVDIDALTDLKAKLIYYWCPHSPLATSFTNFTLTRRSNTIQVQWYVTNEDKSNIYEIEISHDGQNFTSVGKIASQYAAQGAAAKYNYQYLFDQTAGGKLYFRIRQTGPDGKVRYTPIKVMNLDESGASGFTIYPNPVSQKLSLQFKKMLNGNIAIDLVNSAGQVLYRHSQKMTNSNSIQLMLSQPPPSGIYYLRIRDLADGTLYTEKLMVGQ